MLIHTGTKPFKCEHDGCEKKFAQRENMLTHMRTHTGAKPFPCEHDGCEKRFTQRVNMLRHMSTHTGAKPFQCPHPGCNYSSRQREHLHAHYAKAHSKTYRFVCSTGGCGAGFYSSSNFRRHLRTHEGGLITKYVKREEQRIWDLLILNGMSKQIERNVRFTLPGVNGDASKQHEFDMIITKPNVILVLEVDEHCHGLSNLMSDVSFDDHDSDSDDENDEDSEDEDEPEEDDVLDCDTPYAVSCELARQQRLITYLRTERQIDLPISIIRYNPHGFKVNGVRASVPKVERESKLIETIQSWQPNGDELQYMFYSATSVDGKMIADITFHKEYHSLVLQQCREAIVD
jgi:hypothetical protein